MMSRTRLTGDGRNSLDWFAVQVWAGRERLCASRLRARGFEVFLPTYREQRRWSDRIKVAERALFAGYVFLRLQGGVAGSIVTTPGVVRIVGNRLLPEPVADVEMRTIQRVVGAGLATEPWAFLISGQRVRIAGGPLRGCEGTVRRMKSGCRLVVAVSLLRRSVAIEIDPQWVEPLGP